MKTLQCLLIMLSASIGARAQNLVLNGDFAQFFSCPTALSMIDSVQFWNNATINGTPDYFHQCANPFFAGVPVNQIGYQLPHSGEEYAGLYLWQAGTINYREFMIGQLSSPLSSGTCYHFEMYLSLSNYMKHTASNIGVFFSDTLITGILGFQMQAFTPQIVNPAGAYPDTANWMQVSGNYIASGGESFIVIGNFDVDAAVDSMLVNPFGLWPGTHVYVDDLSLTVCTGVNDPVNIRTLVFPNPVNNVLNIETDNHKPAEIVFYNYAMQEVKRQWFTSKTTIDMSRLGAGIYFYKIQPEEGVAITGMVTKL